MRLRKPGIRRAAGALALVLVTSCGGDDSTTPTETLVPTSLSISPGEFEFVFLNQTVSLTVTVLDQNGNALAGAGAVTWTSNDPSVISVTETGIAKALVNGTTTIVAVSDGLTGSATYTVEQVAERVAVVSGDTQEGVAGSALANAVVVVAVDRAASPVVGTTITFSPGPNSGSVSATSVQADANGEAETTWTLGAEFGFQSLTAGIGVAELTITAIARGDTPTPDLVFTEALTVIREDPTSLETFMVQTTVRNEGDAGTGGGFRMQLLSDGVQVGSADFAPLAAGSEQPVEFVVGPFAEGAHVLSVVADADDVIVELKEADNTLSDALSVQLQTVVSAGTPLPSLGGVTDTELLYRLDIPPGFVGALTIELTGGTGDVDLYIEGGTRPSSFEQYDDCRSLGPTTVELCQIVSASGTYHIVLQAFATYTGTTMDITLGGAVVPFDIELVFIGPPGTATQEAAFQAAADRWMTIIPGDVFDVDYSVGGGVPADQCTTGQPEVTEIIDDLRIYVRIDTIDGLGGTLASAGPCQLRAVTFLPILGSMKFDKDDLQKLENDGNMLEVVMHEMGHVLGIGTIWSDNFSGLLQIVLIELHRPEDG